MNPRKIWDLCDTLKAQEFNNWCFESWEAGLNSTERKNLARVKKILNACDELNRNNIKDDSIFYFVSQLVKLMLSDKYDITTTETSYSIAKKKELKGDTQRDIQ